MEDVDELFVDATQDAAQTHDEDTQMGAGTAAEAAVAPTVQASTKRAMPPGTESRVSEVWHMLTELTDTIGQLKQTVERQGKTIDELKAELTDSHVSSNRGQGQRIMPMSYAAAAHRAAHQAPTEASDPVPAKETGRAPTERVGSHPAVVRYIPALHHRGRTHGVRANEGTNKVFGKSIPTLNNKRGAGSRLKKPSSHRIAHGHLTAQDTSNTSYNTTWAADTERERLKQVL